MINYIGNKKKAHIFAGLDSSPANLNYVFYWWGINYIESIIKSPWSSQTGPV